MEQQQFERDVRKDQEVIPAAPQQEQAPAAQEGPGEIEQVLQASVAPGAEPGFVAGLLSSLSPEHQGRGLMWVSQHLGGFFATTVAEHLGQAEGGGLRQQLFGWGQSILDAVRGGPEVQRGPEPAVQAAAQEQAGATQEAGKEGKETLVTHTDPLLGEFQVLFDVDEGLSTVADAKTVTIFSPSGITLKTPPSIPPVTIHRATLSLETGKVEIQSTPDIGEFEEEIIGGILRQTVLKNLQGAPGKSPVESQFANVPKTKDGGLKIYESFWADVILDPATQVTAKLAADGLWVNFSKPIFVDIFGPVNLHIAALQYNFKTASIEIIPEANAGAVRVALEQVVANLGEFFAEKFLRGKLPADMLQQGYDPARDPKLQENMNALIANFSGVQREGDAAAGGQEAAKAPKPAEQAAQEAKEATSAQRATGQDQQQGAAPASAQEGWQSLYRIDGTPLGAITVAMDKGDALGITKTAQKVEVSAGRGIFVVVPGAEWTQGLRITRLAYDFQTGALEIDASKPIGEAVRGALEGLMQTVVIPKLPGEVLAGAGLKEGEAASKAPEGLQMLYRVPVPNLGEAQVMAAANDAVRIQKTDEAVELGAEQGITIRVAGATWIPELRVGRLRYDLKTGAIQIDPPKGTQAPDVGPLAEEILTALVLHELGGKLPGEVRSAAGIGSPEQQEVAAPQGNMIFETQIGIGTLDVSLTDGDTIGFKYGAELVELTVAHGLLVRIPERGIQVRLFDVRFDPKTGALQARTEPPMGAYETAAITGAFREFAWPKLQEFMAQQDDNVNDKHTVLYKADLGGFGQLKICVEAGDALSVQETEEAITVSAAKGVYWLAEGQAKDLLPANRLRQVRFDLKSGEITIDADQDVGPLVESVATRLVHLMVLPKLDPELRTKLFGGQDPTRTDLLQELPEPGGLKLYQGDAGGMAFDLSLDNANFGVESTPEGLVRFTAGGRGVLFRVPSLGIAIYLWDLAFDPNTQKLHTLRTAPEAGAAERGIIEQAAARFAGPLMAQYTGDRLAREAAAKEGERLVAVAGAVQVRVAAGDALKVEHGADASTVTAERGLRVKSDMIRGALPPIRQLRYEHRTGNVSIDLVNQRDTSALPDQQEVGVFTQELLSELGRQLIDPHLTPELRALGLAGREASQASDVQAPKTVPWLDIEAGPLGRVQLLTAADEQIQLQASASGVELRSAHGIHVVLPTLGLSTHIHRLRYDAQTEDVQVEGLGRLENTVLQELGRGIMAKLVPSERSQGQRQQAPVPAYLASLPVKDGAWVIETEQAKLHIPRSAAMTTTLTGEVLRVQMNPRMWIDGPSVGNYHFTDFAYHFGTGEIELGLSGSNILSALIGGIVERKAKEALRDLVLSKLPADMRRRGYNLMADRNRTQNLQAMITNFSSN